MILGGVIEEVRKEEVEGIEMVAVVDDVDFMIGGGDRKEVEERMRKMERTMKVEAKWMGKDRNEWEGGIECESVGSVVSE
ncbi:hypothetical protein C7212DRAFT_332614 [Tuber magnatum]|uniref:Uncharacterized protein n=1 Tax=Tuber magnatum TaxID=42249 RepID=A0A317SIV1_9PEZI|nr:hypothetical protein C7212DRAFT_332614 [Tuber magnatum]